MRYLPSRLAACVVLFALSPTSSAWAQAKAGFIDPSGKFVALIDDPNTVFAGPCKLDRCRFIRDGKQGYLNREAKWVIAPQFETAEDFSDGVAWAKRPGEKWGLIGLQGEQLIPAQYEWAEKYLDGVGFVSADGALFQAIDKQGKALSAPILRGDMKRYEYESGLLVIPEAEGSGLKDLFGRIKIKPNKKLTMYNSMRFGRILVRDTKSNLFGFMDENGKMIIKCEYLTATDFMRDRPSNTIYSIVQNKKGHVGVIDPKGAFIIKMTEWIDGKRVNEIGAFNEGLAPFAVNNKDSKFPWMQDWGYLDLTGKVVIPAQYAWTDRFEDGMGLVSNHVRRRMVFSSEIKRRSEKYNQEPMWGFVNRQGQLTIPIEYDTYALERFRDQPFVQVKKKGVRSYLGKDGKPFFSPETKVQGRWLADNRIRYCENAQVNGRMDQRCGYLDATGAVALQPIYSHTEEFSEGVAYVKEKLVPPVRPTK